MPGISSALLDHIASRDVDTPPASDTDIVGSMTGASMRYLTLIRGEIASAETIGEILAARQRVGLTAEIDHGAVSHLLHDGFVPQPRTVYRDIYAISIGFIASLRQGKLTFQRSFPFALAQSRKDQVPSGTGLLTRLVDATEIACSQGTNTILLLSGGLDSTSLALAARELGRNDICAVTYGEPNGRSEIELAQAVCRRIGLRHEAHILDVASPNICRDLLAYAASTPEPCADPALTACISATRTFAGDNTVILDGSGSDYYFWTPPRPMDLLKMRFGLSRFPLLRQLRQYIPVYLPYERLLSTPLEPFLLHGSWLRHCDSRRFYSESVDTHAFWLREFHDQDSLPREEARYRNRAIYVGPGAHMKKTRNAALAVGARAHFPWANSTVADYCFNLPETSRFDRNTGKSKLVVRDMLRDTASYNDRLIGKRAFLFGKRRFLQYHMAFCRSQILDCTLWAPGVGRELDDLVDMFDRGHATENALFALLMVSLWHNHWIKGPSHNSQRDLPFRQAV